MTRDVISLSIEDVAQFARALRREVEAADGAPNPEKAGHQTWLNRVARAAGYRNFQHLSAARKTAEPLADEKRVARAMRYVDGGGRLAQWPAKTGMQKLCLWLVWAGLPAEEEMSERQISARIDTLTGYGDAAITRRTMVECQMLRRTPDGRVYIRVERRPPPEARALIAAAGERGREKTVP